MPQPSRPTPVDCPRSRLSSALTSHARSGARLPTASARTSDALPRMTATRSSLQRLAARLTPERASTGRDRVEHDRTAELRFAILPAATWPPVRAARHVHYKRVACGGNLLDLTRRPAPWWRAVGGKMMFAQSLTVTLLVIACTIGVRFCVSFDNGLNGVDHCLASPPAALRPAYA